MVNNQPTMGVLKILMVAIAGLASVGSRAQQAVTPHAGATGTQDTTSLLSAFRRGRMHGQVKYFFMATENAGGLSDYYAHAAGGNIKYETVRFKGFQLGVGGFLTNNLGSSDLSQPDHVTGLYNRYEIGLFDITDAHNKMDIDRLEELYLTYSIKKSHLTFGKQIINTPFINPQDGRMRPSATGGLWAVINEIKNTSLQAGFLYEFSPRSTVRWYSTGESIGLFPAGQGADGKRSQYPGNLASGGVVLLGVTHQLSQALAVKICDVFVENIFNSAMAEVNIQIPLAAGDNFFGNAQYIRQDAVNAGGNTNPARSYFPKGTFAQTFGARLGWENSQWKTSLNYNRITADGRYLMPREWGRDPFYTYLPRERNEGYGDATAYVIKAEYNIPKTGIKTELALGYFDLPEVVNYRLNKYGMPAYTQLNMDIHYQFKGWLKGLESQLLYVYKGKSGSSYNDNRYVINKVDMSSWNFIFNYKF